MVSLHDVNDRKTEVFYVQLFTLYEWSIYDDQMKL